ncbi:MULTISPECIES: hypothetical protein [Flavobacterium]|uniref:Uncharacterized protein n=1 Tax=Flavobacterium quisquiliarum TaxID=1834436 RepID=A0ABV8W9S4_9FLAO|nr:hypothetical protein [Flavobacterium quisquiliarum]MBW1657873.1 hypothetical protein [Flavobacterium quisquiliarum]
MEKEIIKSYELSDEQQEILNNQLNLDISIYKEAESVYADLKKKYEL